MTWQPIETAPKDGRIVFAVPVYGSPHHKTHPGRFLYWDAWVDDAAGDWQDMREIGWCMADATHWMHPPQPPEGE